MTTKQYGLLGRKLTHSFSPQIHSYFYDTPYTLFETEPEALSDFMQSSAFTAMNVTIPYKQDVIPFCAALSETAKKIGSVNTIVRRKDNTLFGDNTDYYGFSYLVQSNHISVQGKKAVILGSGGSSLTVQHVLRDLGAKEIVVISRTGENNYENISRHTDCDILVNTTPVGMFPKNGAAPVDISIFPNCAAVLDIIYNPAKTKLLLDAEKCGKQAVNGLAMLVAQAKKSAEIFTNEPIPDSRIAEITKALSRQTQNILLIGMPGCGKTTIGKALAEMLNRPFLDTDHLLEEKIGKPIPELIETEGEEAFRKLETEILGEAAKQSGKIIATGGGIVTRPENYDLVKQNSVVFFLDRDLKDLETKGRPLSQKFSVETLYAQRAELYTQFSDFRVPVQGIAKTANQIKERFYS